MGGGPRMPGGIPGKTQTQHQVLESQLSSTMVSTGDHDDAG